MSVARMAELDRLIASGQGDARRAQGHAKRDSLVQFAAPAVAALRREAVATERLLDQAYQRACFVCHDTGRCTHREPAVELALLGVRERCGEA